MEQEIFYDVQGNPHIKPAEKEAAWRPSVYAVIRDQDGNILLIKPEWNNQWELPGGGMNKGETIEEALRREVLEETGYHVASVERLPIHIGEYRFYLRRSKQFCYTICFSYRVGISSESRDTSKINVELPGEVAKMHWVPLAELAEQNCHPITRPVIQLLT